MVSPTAKVSSVVTLAASWEAIGTAAGVARPVKPW